MNLVMSYPSVFDTLLLNDIGTTYNIFVDIIVKQ